MLLGPFERDADGIEPAADVDLGVTLAAEVAGGFAVRGFSAPFVDGEGEVAALDDKPVHGVVGGEVADFTFVFAGGGHQ